jgi:hypothetical protein
MTYRPQARCDEITVHEVGDELVVYDTRSRRLATMNESTSAVFRACDGTHTVTEIAALLAGDLSLEDRTTMVWSALDELAKADLLNAEITVPDEWLDSRRELMQKGGAALLALPIVGVALAPTPAESASVVIGGGGGDQPGISIATKF